MGTTTGEFIQKLTRDRDVIVIGGLAIIAHGFNRPTKDVDVWLDPLESKIRSLWVAKLPLATAEEARSLFERYVDWQTCEAALRNPDLMVKEIAMGFLREFAEEGDPFSAAILEDREIPPP